MSSYLCVHYSEDLGPTLSFHTSGKRYSSRVLSDNHLQIARPTSCEILKLFYTNHNQRNGMVTHWRNNVFNRWATKYNTQVLERTCQFCEIVGGGRNGGCVCNANNCVSRLHWAAINRPHDHSAFCVLRTQSYNESLTLFYMFYMLRFSIMILFDFTIEGEVYSN